MTAAPVETDLRTRILDASVALLEEKGLADFSLREVARRAGVSHQAPYHYFSDREAILAAVCEQGFSMLTEMLAAARASGASLGDRVEGAFIAYVDFACRHPAHFRIMFRPELVELEKHAHVEHGASRCFDYLPAMVTECVQAGLPEGPGMDALITAIWSQIHGLSCLLLDGPLQMKVPRAAEDRAGLVRDTVRVFRGFLDAAMAQGPQAAKGAAAGKRKASNRAKRVKGTKA